MSNRMYKCKDWMAAKTQHSKRDTFTHNDRSELTAAAMGGKAFAYDYDNIGNRKTAQEKADDFTYTANALNQYTQITENAEPFAPEFDADGNQTRTTITNHRFLYRGYLQIAALNLTRSTLNDLWLITWDPTESVATRPLAIQQSGTWYVYGTDLPKNVTELYSTSGYIHTAYTYSPYGLVTASGNVTQPIQWSCEYADTDLGLVYYNYRHYNPLDGRWTGRDPEESGQVNNSYDFATNQPNRVYDLQGKKPGGLSAAVGEIVKEISNAVGSDIASVYLGRHCDPRGAIMGPIPFAVGCTRVCKSFKWYGCCLNRSGGGIRSAYLRCEQSYGEQEWVFHGWASGSLATAQCLAAPCGSGCMGKKVEYEDEPMD